MSAIDLPLTDPYLCVLYSTPTPDRTRFDPATSPRRPSTASSPFPRASDASPSNLQMTDLSSIPPHVVRFFVLAAPLVAGLRRGLEVVLWKQAGGKGRGWSWALLGAWWAVCLGATSAAKFLLPPFVLLAFVYPSLPRPATLLPARLRRLSTSTTPLPPDSSPKVLSGIVIPQGQQPATVQSVQIALADFSALSTLVQASWPPGWVALVRAKLDGGGWRVVTRALLGIWAVWVFGSLVMGLRIMLALAGTIVLLAPSPYSPPILRALESSFFLNRLWLFIVHLVLGPSTVEGGSINPLRWAWTRSKIEARAAKRERGRSASMKALLGTIKRSLSRSSAAQTEVDGTARPEESGVEEKKDEWDEEPVVFRFEVMENQRWWLALDWTGTLAPGDRPIWCDTHLHPTPPPPQFTLPPAHTTTIPHALDPHFNEVRVASWRWAEDDWSVLRSVDHSNPKGPFFVPTKVAHSDSATGASPLPAGASQKDVSAAAQNAGPAAMSPSSRMSLGEQALSRGLERLKAATASASPPPSTTVSTSNLPSSNSSTSLTTSPTRASGSRPSIDGGSERKTLFAMSLGASTTMEAQEDERELEDLDALTDEAGWSYGGNKWEGMGPKGGLGKFTRRRRWVRLAVLEEHVHLFPKTFVLPTPPSAPTPPSVQESDVTVSGTTTLNDSTTATLIEETLAANGAGSSTTARSAGGEEVGGLAGGPSEALRLRLRKAVEKGQR